MPLLRLCQPDARHPPLPGPPQEPRRKISARSEAAAQAEAQVKAASKGVTAEDRGSTLSRPVVKKDAESLLAGRPVYTDDLAPENALVVKLVRSGQAHAW